MQGVSHDDIVAGLRAKSAAVVAKLEAFWLEGSRRERLVQALLEGHLPLTRSDLSDWTEDPESWYHAHEGVSSEDEPRGIAEILFLVRCALQHVGFVYMR